MYEKLLDKINNGERKIPFKVLNVLFNWGLIKFDGNEISLTKFGSEKTINYFENERIEEDIRNLKPKKDNKNTGFITKLRSRNLYGFIFSK